MSSPGTLRYAQLANKPSPPPVGYDLVYVKTDDVLYIQDSAGVEVALGSASSITQLTGDVSATGPGIATATVNSVGGQSATNIANAVIAYLAATSSDTHNTLIIRDGSGNFAAGLITANLMGNVTGNLNGNVTGGTVSATTITASVSITGLVHTQGLQRSIVGKTSAYTLTINDDIVGVDASGGSVIITLPPATTKNVYTIIKVDSSSNVVTVVPSFGDNISGQASVILTNRYDAYTVDADGTNTYYTTATVIAGTGPITALTGDVSASGPGSAVATVNTVGGQTAAAIATTATSVAAATSSNTPNTLIKRDGSGNFSAGTITASLTGNVLGNVTGNVSGSSSTFTGSLSGDVTGTQSATVISATTVTGKLLTGYVTGTNTPITASNSILTAFENLQAQVSATIGSAITSLTGDVAATGPGAAASTVVAIQGTSVNATAPIDAQFLVYESGITSYKPVSLSGDATMSDTGVLTLDTVNGNVGSFGSSTAIPSFTVNAKGLITAASSNAVIAPAGTLSGTTLNSTVVNSSLTSVGTITSGVWNGTPLTAPYMLALPTNDIYVGNGSNQPAAVPMSGDVSIVSSGATSISATTVTGKLLTGYVTGTNTPITASNSILTAFENLQAQVSATTGAAITSLTGDVTATGPGATAATVTALQGHSVSTTAPTDAQILIWNSSTSKWTPESVTSDINITDLGVASIVATTNSTITTLSSLSLPGSQVTGNISGNAANVTGVVAILHGGTGQTTANAGFKALSPMTTLGDIIYEDATPTAARLAGNTTNTREFLTSQGSGGLATAPTWSALVSGDIPNNAANTTGTASNITASSNSTLTTLTALALPTSQLTGTISLTTQVAGILPILNGGTGQSTKAAAFDALSPTTTKGDLIAYSTGTNIRVAVGTNGQVLTADSTQPSGLSYTTPTTGTVTSVALSLPSIFNVTGSPVTSSGTLTATFNTETANTIFAGPTSGGAATPIFRTLVSADIPAINLAASGNGGVTGVLPIANGGTSQTTAAAARGPSGLNIDERSTFSNAPYTVLSTDRYVAQIGTMTASRIVTLPAANSVNAGQQLTIADESGTVTTTNILTITAAGSDTIDGSVSKTIRSGYGYIILYSNGTNGWFVGVEAIGHGGTGISTLPTDGQILIGQSSSSSYVLSTITAGTGITITNGSGSITVAGNQISPTTTKTTNYTILSTDSIIFCDTSGGAFTLTLPSPATLAGKIYRIIDTTGNFQTNNLTLAPSSTEKIEGLAASKVLQTNWGWFNVTTNGTDWYVG